jgi:hypothetical protein
MLSTYSDSWFKYPVCRISEAIVRFMDGLYRGSYNSYYNWCSYHSKSVYAFFSERRREHYDELNNNVFSWLDNLWIDYFDDGNEQHILQEMDVGIRTDSPFYHDARRHMSKKMKQNIEDLEMDLNVYNVYIQNSNVIIDSRIREIIARPAYAKLTNEEVSSIYGMLQVGFSQAIRGTEEISTYIRKWDFSSKLRSYGFNTDMEVNTGSAIFGAIQYDQNIIEPITKVRSNRIDLQNKIDVIRNQSKEISSKIASHHYQARRRCCPSFIKELGF